MLEKLIFLSKSVFKVNPALNILGLTDLYLESRLHHADGGKEIRYFAKFLNVQIVNEDK